MSTAAKPGPRERLLASAQRLTAVHGVAVGVDAILEDASVARRSLYQHFRGKDELIASSLTVSARQDEDRYRAALHSGASAPPRRVLPVSAQLENTTPTPHLRACTTSPPHRSPPA